MTIRISTMLVSISQSISTMLVLMISTTLVSISTTLVLRTKSNSRITYKNNIEKEKIEFYRDEIEKSNNHSGYISFVEFLLIDEQTGEPLNGVLRMNGQIGYEDWLLLERKIKILEQSGYKDTLKNKILSLVNNKKYNGKYDNLFKTMNTWINGDAQKREVKLPENERFRKVIRDEKKAPEYDKKPEGAIVEG